MDIVEDISIGLSRSFHHLPLLMCRTTPLFVLNIRTSRGGKQVEGWWPWAAKRNILHFIESLLPVRKVRVYFSTRTGILADAFSKLPQSINARVRIFLQTSTSVSFYILYKSLFANRHTLWHIQVFKKSFTTLKECTHLYTGHTQRFELS
jgi:hypothetical protein